MTDFMPKLALRKKRLALAAATARGEVLREVLEDPVTGKFGVLSTQDAEPILRDAAARMATSSRVERSKEGLGTMAALIPNTEIEKLIHQGINPYRPEDRQKFLEILDSPDFRKFRCSYHRLSNRPVRHYFRASTPAGCRIARPKGPLRLAQ